MNEKRYYVLGLLLPTLIASHAVQPDWCGAKLVSKSVLGPVRLEMKNFWMSY
jgi:hypothetical protein